MPALRLLTAHYNGGAVLVGMDFVLRPLAVAEQHQIARGNHLRIPHIRLWTAKTGVGSSHGGSGDNFQAGDRDTQLPSQQLRRAFLR